MKLSLKKAILLSIVLLTTLSLKAQYDDRLITNKNDTVACKLSRNMFGAFKYKTGKGGAALVEKGDVKEFYSANKKTWVRRIYITSSRIPCYMTVLELGKISLYEMDAGFTYYNGNGWYYDGPKTQWFAAKGTDTAELIKDTENKLFNGRKLRKTHFMDLIEDNKDVYDKYLADDKFSFKQLRRLVHLYNTGQPLEGDN